MAPGSTTATRRLSSWHFQAQGAAVCAALRSVVPKQIGRFARECQQVYCWAGRRQRSGLPLIDASADAFLLVADLCGFLIIRARVDALIQSIFIHQVQSLLKSLQLCLVASQGLLAGGLLGQVAGD
ncbi:MAG: hypothetical protein ABSH32_27420 [Bryobacteraceae bacterium]|jgi:hypothetical protein